MRRVLILLPVLAVLAAAGCTSSGTNAPTSQPPQTIYSTTTQTRPATTTTSTAGPSTPTPISGGPTTTTVATSCPLLATQTAADKAGMRLQRITVLKAGGKVVGCRFYAQQEPNSQCDATCLAKEKLPPGNQAVVDIATTRYRTAVDAHNAIALIARKGNQPQQVDIGVDNIGVCYETDFYPKDNGTDWACTFSVAKVAVVVKTVAQESSSARAVAVEVAAKL